MNMQLTPIVKNLLIINGLVWVSIMILIQANAGIGEMIYNDFFSLHKSNILGLREVVPMVGGIEGYPYGRGAIPANGFNPLQIITHFFSHSQGSLNHIFFNMFGLLMIGPAIEMAMGAKRFLQFYLFCGILGGIFVAFLDPSPIPVVGASGALFGLLLAFAVYYPNARLLLFFVLPMKSTTLAWVAGLGSAALLLLNFVNPGSGTMGGISHFGHLAGMVAGLIFFYIRPHIPFLN
ncbi:MAG: rhomboid family intramembrane serine protease [Bacteroidia bacterium]